MILLWGALFSIFAGAKSLPSTVSIGAGWDSTESRTGSADVEVGVKTWGFVDGGVTTTRTQYDGAETKTRSYRLGLRSNPLYDWSFALLGEYNEFSEQMESTLVTLPVNYYWGDFGFRFTPGWRVLKVQLTQQVQSSDSEVVDRSFYGSLDLTYFMSSRFSVNLYYSQYSYQNNFTALTRDGALLFGYLPATIESAAGLLNNSLGVGGSYFYRKVSLSADISTSETEFVDSRLNMFTLSFGYALSKRFYLTAAKGGSVVKDGTEEYRGSFTNLGLSYTLP